MRFGTESATILSESPQPLHIHYLLGKDPSEWITEIPTYGRIVYRDIQPGIDLVFYGDQGLVKYDFLVQPGADPDRIRLTFQGQDSLEALSDGLVIHTRLGDIAKDAPLTYQATAGVTQQVANAYRIEGNVVSFDVGAYDQSQPLVIDPLVYSTFLGGSDAEWGHAIDTDSSGAAYITGTTYSTDFPTTPGAYWTTAAGGFVTKFDAAGAMVYSTYIAGPGNSIAVSGGGEAFVAGNAFAIKLDATGSSLAYGAGLDGIGHGIAVDSAGNAYVTGEIDDSSMTATSGAYQTSNAGWDDAFVVKLDSTGSVSYATYLGGMDHDYGLSIAVDANGDAYVSGSTLYSGFPTTTGAYQTAPGGFWDAFVAKFDSTGGLVYSTRLGGSGQEVIGVWSVLDGIAVDSNGDAYVVGTTWSPNFPTTPGAYQATMAATTSSDLYVTKLDSTGSSLVYSTYIGGTDLDWGAAIDIDAAGNAYVTGGTWSGDYPTTVGALQSINAGANRDVLFSKLDATGSTLAYSTYIGGCNDDFGYGIAVDGTGVTIGGFTQSPNYPTTLGAYQTNKNGWVDAFATKVDASPGAPLPMRPCTPLDDCPPGTVGIPPNCNPVPPPSCQPGDVGVTPPACFTPCPAPEIGFVPDCHAPCTPPDVGAYEPACVTPCPAPSIGVDPDCHAPCAPPDVGAYEPACFPPCQPGDVGVTPPACATPCPAPSVGIDPDCHAPCTPPDVGAYEPACFPPCQPGDVGVTPPACATPCPAPSIGVDPDCHAPCTPPELGYEPACVPPPINQCADGADNDGDGYSDGNDCYPGSLVESPLAPCSDGIDNDSDLAPDWPADGGCSNPFDPTE